MKELIKIQEQNGNSVVSARELHSFLEVTERFNNWCNRMFEYGFYENVDYTSVKTFTVVNNGAKKTLDDYALTLDTAKEISMLQRSEKGKQARRYFIDCEKKLKNKVLDFSDASVVLQLAQNFAEEQKRRLQAEKENLRLKPKAELMDKVMATDEKIDIGQTAKILNLPFGRNTLFKKLREKGVFFKNKNEPKQEYIQRGYFELREQLIQREHHDSFVVIKVLVSQRGLAFIDKIFTPQPVPKQMAIFQ